MNTCTGNCNQGRNCTCAPRSHVPATAWFTVGFVVSMAILSAMVAIVRVG